MKSETSSGTQPSPASRSTTILTVGHSTRTFAELLAILTAHGVERVVDVRSLPRSRRHPHFDRDALAAELAAAGIGYAHRSDLGGLRGASDSPDHAGLPKALRGYGAHMETPAFAAALEELMRMAERERVVILCAEADPAHCHRSLIADALTARGVMVEHLLDPSRRIEHAVTRGAVIEGARVRYPAKQRSLRLGRARTETNDERGQEL
ncbi:MAG TPA: DUF488 domain-containing protein [Candidatus Limnocylindria bacterium]|nr:DUF488 domain-containing protein [Candidatus Limnocylindria bacterium]